MNKEAKVGDYIRTKTGIHKVFEIRKNAPMNRYMCDKKPTGEWDGSYEYNLIRVNDIIDVSADIIDLIRVGDILSFKDNSIARIQEIEGKYYLLKDCSGEQYYEKDEWLFDDLKSIVTKEQFENMEFKVGDEQ